MGKEKEKNATDKLEGLLLQLTRAKVNDAVKLAFLNNEDRELIDKMDLTALTEFKRAGNGAVEVRFVDRVGIIERLLELRREDPTETLLRQLSGGGDE